MSGFWGNFLTIFSTLALDATAALLGGGKSETVQGLKNKSYRSDAFGTPWSRCRGVVRLQGKEIWGTPIQTSLWKSVSGGLFGIGQKSVTYEKYSKSMFIGFGYKLNGGPAISFLRIWADGKLLFNKAASTGNITGAVTVTTVMGGQQVGSQFLEIDLASGASVTINAGDLIIVPGDPQPYTAQTTIVASGPASALQVPVWPPLRFVLSGGGQVQIPPVSGSPYDLSSFDPNPHDGTHFVGGYPALNGGIDFYLGTETQGPDPTMTKWLHAGNVPGFRGLACCCIHDLQLANYGDHPPNISAEIAFDVAGPLFPMIGPLAGADITLSSLTPEFFALPFSGNGSLQFKNPLLAIPYMWVRSQNGPGGTDGTIYRVNTATNQVEASTTIPSVGTFGLTPAGMVADADGMLYFIQNNSVLSKMDGFSLNITKQWSTGFPNIPESIYPFDSAQSLFGNTLILKLMYVSDWIFDRTVLLRLGAANPGSTENCVLWYDQNGNPVVGPGDPVSFSLNVPNNSMTDDSKGNIWGLAGSPYNFLLKIDCQFISMIDPNSLVSNPLNPKPILALPTFATTSIDISSINHGAQSSIQYYPGDDTIVIFGGNNQIGKVSASTNAIIQIVTTAGSGTAKLGQMDVMGTILINGPTDGVRIDLNSLTILNTYVFTNWFPPGVGIPLGGYPVFDPATDSVWIDASNNGITFGGLNRIFLDRGNGSGIGLDRVISSLLLEAGYQSSEFDVTKITAAGLTIGGVEFERESYLDSLRKLMTHYLFDVAEIDGKLTCVPHGQPSVVTIPEDDLGALDDPFKYEPRATEMLEDERDSPQVVTIKYYDYLKDDQQATQEERRISRAYPSSLSTSKPNISSNQQVDIVSPIFEYATPVKQQAAKILWDLWAGRYKRKFKLPLKYIRLDPTDVITLDYKGLLLETRLTECDFGSGFAREMQGESQDQSVYDVSQITASSSGSGGGVIPTPQTNPGALSYTISPTYALSQGSPTDIDMLAATATWSDGRITQYNARSFTVPDPGVGNTALYYVTMYDPSRIGEIAGTNSLTPFIDTNPANVNLNTQPQYVFIGTILITHTGTGVVVTSGGSNNISTASGFYVNGGGGGSYTTQIDLVDYFTMKLRATNHLAGSAANTPSNKFYSYVDNAIQAFAFVKATAGWANDILLWDSPGASNPSGVPMIYHLITELDDVDHPDWGIPTSYKKNEDAHGYTRSPGLPIAPRFMTVGGGPFTVGPFASPNNYGRYVSCSKIDTKNKGNFFSITFPPQTMNIDGRGTTVGNLGNIQVVVNERYSGQKQRERFYGAIHPTYGGLGLVMWDAALLIGGTQGHNGQYQIFNWSVHNQIVSGGGVSSSFGCGWGVGWP